MVGLGIRPRALHLLSTLPLISISNSKTQVKYSVSVGRSHPQSMKMCLSEECFLPKWLQQDRPSPLQPKSVLAMEHKPNPEHREESMRNRPQAEPCRTIDVQLLYTILSGYVSLLVCALTTPTDLVICTVLGLYITHYNLFSCTTACSSLLQPHNVWETVALLLNSPFKTFFFLESTLGPLSFHVNFRVSPNIPKTQIRLY